MTKRERVKRAIAHQSDGGVPINIELTANFDKNLCAYAGVTDAGALLGNHMLRVKYKRLTPALDGNLDTFGVLWDATIDGGDVGFVKRYPIEELDGLYRFPQPDLSLAQSVLDALAADTERYRMFSLTMGFFERAWSLYGMENLLADMCLEPEAVHALFDGIFEHHSALLDFALEGDFEALYFGDDWGQQSGLIMGPRMWREFIKPRVAALFDKAKLAGKQIVLHSCGDLRSILGEVIDMGVDVYNTVQPEIYDLDQLKKEYGAHLTFYGGISTQQFLPYADAGEVYQKTMDTLRIMAKGGGYILSPTHAVTGDIPPQNILAMRDACEKFNRT